MTCRDSTEKLEERLGYRFKDARLLKRALTHKSFGRPNNERLEFLGDAILGFVIAHRLFERDGKAQEDELSLLRAHLVRGSTLAVLARELEVGDYLKLGEGERKSGGRGRASILANAMEAIFGAVLLDGGTQAAEQVICRVYDSRLATLNAEDLKDAKTKLQERLQAHKEALPEYKVTKTEGADHARRYHVECRIDGARAFTGVASSRRKAEQAAAEEALNWLQQRG